MRGQCLAVAATVLVVTLGAVSPAAGSGIIYQPQNRDAAVSEAQWQQLFQAVEANGTETLTIQWLQYSNQSFTEGEAWLRRALAAAEEAGLELRLGLVWDPEYFKRMSPRANLAYFEELLAENEALRASLDHEWSGKAFIGWYLPLELSDRFGHTPEARRAITAQLADFAKETESTVAVSAYFTGQLAPATFTRWIKELRNGGIDVWVQDGYGAGMTPSRAIPLYLKDLPCNVPVILEHFRRTSPLSEDFEARPATAAERERRARQVACHPQHSFSLRYHPAADGILAH